MHIIYAATTCSDGVYESLFADTPNKPAFQSQKYHRLLMEGLAANAQVDAVANPPINRSVLKKFRLHLPMETVGNLRYHYVDTFRNPILKAASVFFGTFFRTLTLARKDSAVIVDCLSRTAALAAQLAAKLRGCRCVGVVTDLPDMLSDKGLARKMANLSIRLCSDYVLLTEAMNDYIQNPGKPYVVLEGHADIAMEEKKPSLDAKNPKRVCLYAGSLSRRYGLGDLVEGFLKSNLPNTQLHIYGRGDFEAELKEYAAKDSRIVYGGMLLAAQVVEKEMKATLLVNPRPINEEYVKYSFPSKTMEYMSTGTPVLMTRLPGLPREYYPHLYFIDDCTPEGIANALRKTFALTDEELFRKGCEARRFILEKRNNVIQAQKILQMLEK